MPGVHQHIVTAASRPEFVTVPNVELFSVGTWDASSGRTTVTQEDLVAAVAALGDPAVPLPRLKIGHEDNVINDTKEQPCFGKVDNLRLSEDGMTLMGDFVGVPRWLADIMATAYPSRSIEGYFNIQTATGKTHAFMMTACALLGTSMPAVETLEDLKAVFYEHPEDFIAATRDAELVVFNSKEENMPEPQFIAAAISVDDVYGQYYESLNADQMWWWVREVFFDPAFIIVDTDGDGLLRIPYTADGDNVVFGTAERVKIEYVPMDTKNGEALAASRTSFSSRAETRPDNEHNQEDNMDLEILESLGLAEGATTEEVTAAITQLREASEAPATEAPATPEIPEGMSLVDNTVLDELRVAAEKGEQAFKRQQAEDKERLLDGAVKERKFTRARKEHFSTLYDADPVGTKELIEKMAAGVVPTEEIGGTGNGSDFAKANDDAYPAHWLPELANRNSNPED